MWQSRLGEMTGPPRCGLSLILLREPIARVCCLGMSRYWCPSVYVLLVMFSYGDAPGLRFRRERVNVAKLEAQAAIASFEHPTMERCCILVCFGTFARFNPLLKTKRMTAAKCISRADSNTHCPMMVTPMEVLMLEYDSW